MNNIFMNITQAQKISTQQIQLKLLSRSKHYLTDNHLDIDFSINKEAGKHQFLSYFVSAVRSFTLVCQGWFSMKFIVQGKATKQVLYICKKIKQLYFSKAACIDIGMLPKDFPNSVATISTQANSCSTTTEHPPMGQNRSGHWNSH